jgi:hypothetical protein
MAVSEQISQLTPYVRRLLQDDDLQKQIATGFTNLRDGTQRARSKGPKKAAGDRRVRHRLTAAATAGTQIVRALREPEPPPRHRGRRILTLTIVAAGAVVGYRRVAAKDATTRS